MDETYTALLSGFIGALIGALASIVTMLIQARIQDKRERLRMAAQLASAEHKFGVKMITEHQKRGVIQPMTVFLHYHVRLMELMEKGKLTPENLRALCAENQTIMDTIAGLQDNEIIKRELEPPARAK